MCGIAGFLGSESAQRCDWMTRLLAHRGPDDAGTWSSTKHRVSLGNRRLKILDLSPMGHQPMVSADGRYVLTFNGEIYNFTELRAELEQLGHAFHSRTDTEVLLAALLEWGSGAVSRLNGMFAFAYWDDSEGRLLLARDRLGIKPLYYTDQADSFCFASEITPVLGSGIVEPRLDPLALESYLRLLWVPEPKTLFDGILKLEPGHLFVRQHGVVRVQPYWELPSPEGESGPIEEERLVEVLRSATRRQLQSDVPVGAFLSGGLDSTTLLSLMGAKGSRTIRTYSIGITAADRTEEGALDDVRYAKIAAEEFKASHQEIILDPDVVDLLPRMVRHLEDPVADPAAINCYLVCKAARETSTVLLSGTGADELFGGYRKYAAESLAHRYRMIPGPLRSALLEPVARNLPISIGHKGFRSVRFAKKFLRYANASPFDRFLGYTTYYDAPELEELLGGDPTGAIDPYMGVQALRDAWDRRRTDQVIDQMTYVDLKYYLPGLGLAYMDKASMAASVEVRVPLIDDEVVDLVARLPDRYKVDGLRTKVLLRRAMKGRIPDVILRRPKVPFAAPIRTWLRRDLAPMISDCLSPGQVLSRSLLNPGVVYRLLREHRQGWEDHSLRIWALLTLEIWVQEFYDNRSRFKMPEGVPEAAMTVTAAEN